MAIAEPLLAAEGLWRSYPRRRGPAGRRAGVCQALRGVDLAVAPGEALGIVGRSGSGKSTLARLLLALEPPDRGSVRFAGTAISGVPEAAVRPLRRRFQAVFQDPSTSLDPCLRVATIIAEPLAAHGLGSAGERRARVAELLELVGLPTAAGARFPDAFSGGERQRIAIARALAPRPELLVLDEPLSSLDASVRLRILDLIGELRERLGLALVMIAHDLGAVRGLCERTMVMDHGEVVEEGATFEVLQRPRHPLTRKLVAASTTRCGA